MFKKGLYLAVALVLCLFTISLATDVDDQMRFWSKLFPQITIEYFLGGAGDSGIVFNGNAEDFYIALDDSADDLIIGLGSTVGTTPVVTISDSGSGVPTLTLTGQLVPVQVHTTATGGTLTAAECGTTHFLKDATPDLAFVLPANATAGCEFTFKVAIDLSADQTVTAATVSTIFGQFNLNNTITECDAEDVFTFENGADSIGDWITVISDGTNWSLSGLGADGSSISCTT